MGGIDWLFLIMGKRKQVSLWHVNPFIMEDKCMLGFNLSRSHLKVSFRRVARQSVENAVKQSS